jgi:hypothetical protein
VTPIEVRAWAGLNAALKARGFAFVQSRRGVTLYRGEVQSGKTSVAVRLGVSDPLLTRPPKIYIEDPTVRRQLSAHLNGDESLCFSEAEVEEYDPYNSGGAILRVLESARETLDQILHASTLADRRREFVSYWNPDTYLYTDLPPGFSGPARSCSWNVAGGRDSLVITTPGRVRLWTRDKPAEHQRAYVLRSDRPFDIRLGGGPGKSLASLKAWIALFVDSSEALAEAFAPTLVDKGVIVLAAENGVVSASFKWPEFARIAYAKAPAERRARPISHAEDQMTLNRGLADSVALADLVNGRLDAPSPLIGKAVAVVGAGAIGSRVCLELARSGAGQASRPMLVIDHETYSTANFGRHVLPIACVRLAKAIALTDEIRRLHPDLRVEGIVGDVFSVISRLQAYDLVIDATGSTPVGLRLNDFAVTRRRQGEAFPPVIHAAIHGNGLAAQTVLVTGPPHACLKCLRLVHGQVKATPLKPGVTTAYQSATCGDGAHINYAAPAPMLAAALVVQAALEWAGAPTAPGPRVRTRVLDLEQTAPAKDRNWPAEPHCPACQSRRT